MSLLCCCGVIFSRNPRCTVFRIGESVCFALLVAHRPFRTKNFARVAEPPCQLRVTRKPFRRSQRPQPRKPSRRQHQLRYSTCLRQRQQPIRRHQRRSSMRLRQCHQRISRLRLGIQRIHRWRSRPLRTCLKTTQAFSTADERKRRRSWFRLWCEAVHSPWTSAATS